MIRAAVRAVLCAGAAAALALVAREPLARHLVSQLDGPVGALADAARRLSPRAPETKPDARRSALPDGNAEHGVPEVRSGTASPAASGGASVATSPLGPTPRFSAKPKRGGAPGTYVVTRAALDDALAHGLPGASATLVRDDDGRPAGLRLAGVAPLGHFGVRDGDVLVSANGLPLRSADEALAALGALKDARRVTVVLRRGAAAYAVSADLVD